jgi:hypothetical protein
LVPADYEMDQDPLRTDPAQSRSRSIREDATAQGRTPRMPILSIVMKTDDIFGTRDCISAARRTGTVGTNPKQKALLVE